MCGRQIPDGALAVCEAGKQPLNTLLQGNADGGQSLVGQTFSVQGWVRTVRNQKKFAFLEVRCECTVLPRTFCGTGLRVTGSKWSPASQTLPTLPRLHTSCMHLIASPCNKTTDLGWPLRTTAGSAAAAD